MSISDPVVLRAIQLLEQAILNLNRNNKYNGGGLGYHDYMINGLDDVISRAVEPLLRTWVTKDFSQAADNVAYNALGTAEIQMGIPQSRFKPIIDKLKAKVNGGSNDTKGNHNPRPTLPTDRPTGSELCPSCD